MFYLPFVIFEPEDTMDIMDTSPQQESIAILIREESDLNTIKEVFGDAVLQSINPVTSRDPRSIKDLLLSQITPVRSCFVIVESENKVLIKLVAMYNFQRFLLISLTYNCLIQLPQGFLWPMIFILYVPDLQITSIHPQLEKKKGIYPLCSG